MSSYAGREELKQYIEINSSPSFNGFVAHHSKDILEWSIDLNVSNYTSLHGLWFERFKYLYEQLHDDSEECRKPKFNHLLWRRLLTQIKRRKQLQSTYQEGAIDVLVEAGSSAIDLGRRLVNTPSQILDDSNTAADVDDDSNTPTDAAAPSDASTSSNTLSVAASDTSPTTLSTSQLSFSLQAPRSAPFIVDGVDVSERFYLLQQHVFDFVKTNNLALESDTHLILSLSSILLLQNNNRLHQVLVPFLGNGLYNKIRKHNLDDWNMNHTFPGDVLLEAINITQNLYGETTDRINACASLLLLSNSTNDAIDKRLLVSASQLVQLLPLDATNTEISETTFITRYLSPALQPLFDNHERNVRLEFTSSDLADNHKRSPSFNGCPDCIITIFEHQSDDGTNVGYGEVKRQSMAGNHHLVNWDLMRLAVFGKDAIDRNKLCGNLAIHVVGPFVTFYLIKLHADGLYMMTELARIQIPMSILEVPAYLTNFSRLKNVIYTFETFCTPDNNNEDVSSWRRDSLLTTDVMFVLNKKKDRKRKNTAGHYA